MIEQNQIIWNESFVDPSTTRMMKPRREGITMIIDKGLGISSFLDVLQTSAAHVDYIKLGFGTSVLYPQSILMDKIKLANEYQVSLYPGGTFFEVAFTQKKIKEYFQNLIQWGFDTVEISDGSIFLSQKERNSAIQLAKELGLHVITECGKKVSGSTIELLDLQKTLEHDLTSGAQYMIIEGRESGANVGIYNAEGKADKDFIKSIKETLGFQTESLIWEAPQKSQQIALLELFGTNVNLGNISPLEIYSLESLRRGLRSDTFHLSPQ